MTHTNEKQFDLEQEETKRLLAEAAQQVEAHLQEQQQRAQHKPSASLMEMRSKRQVEYDTDNAKPFLERRLWRRIWMYKWWDQEEIVTTPTDRSAITRSHHGFEVLNTPDLGVVDVDFNFDYDLEAQQCESLSQLKSWCDNHPDQSFRAYKTCAGLRFLRTDAPMPLDADYDALCEMVAADEVYRHMCRQEQNCFRVRISPKPARIGAPWPVWSPYEGYISEFDTDTIRNYEQASEAFKTCEFLGTIGSGLIHPMLKPLIELHDLRCRIAQSGLKVEEPLLEERIVPIRYIDAVVFNRKYRPNGMAPDDLWESLDHKVQRRLKELDLMDNLSSVLKEHYRCTAIENKWRGKSGPAIRSFFSLTKKKCQSLGDYRLWTPQADHSVDETYRPFLSDGVCDRILQGGELDLLSRLAMATSLRRSGPSWGPDGIGGVALQGHHLCSRRHCTPQ